MKIIPMQMQHINEIAKLENICFHTPWTKKDFERELIENKLAIYRIAIDDNKILGYAGMWHVINEGHITNIAVIPNMRRTGVGSLLLLELINIAISKEMIGLTLEVSINNIAAQKLYTKYSFKPEGIRKGYYNDVKEDAIIMWKYL